MDSCVLTQVQCHGSLDTKAIFDPCPRPCSARSTATDRSLGQSQSQTRRLLQFRPADVPAAFSWPRTAYPQATGTLHCSGEEPCLCLCLLLALTWLISWWASTPNIILLLDQGNKRGRFIHQYNRQLSFLMPNTQASTPFSLFGFTTFSFCLSSIVNDDDLISS